MTPVTETDDARSTPRLKCPLTPGPSPSRCIDRRHRWRLFGDMGNTLLMACEFQGGQACHGVSVTGCRCGKSL
jgi:hypothetical protein